MQTLTSRQNRLLKHLLQRREYVTLSHIAHYLNVSEKTVRRDMHFINVYLAEWHIALSKKNGAGIMLMADDITDILRLEQQLGLEDDDADAMLNNSRRVKIASQLLSETPRETSISKLSERYFISSASIVNDLKVIESWIAPLGLTLIRSQSGTRIEGSENCVRQAMAALINSIINHKEPGCLNHSRLDPGSYKALVQYFGEDDVLFVQNLLQDMERELSYPLGEPYYVNIFTHILIMMYRIVRGNSLPKNNIQGRQRFDHKIFIIARAMVEKIEARIAHPLPNDETGFIYQYIISSGIIIEERADCQTVQHPLSSDESRQVTRRLISAFSTMADINLFADVQLYDGLLVHIRPLINRLNYQIHIRNPLLDEIKNELPDIYQLTSVAVNNVFHTLPMSDVTEDEIGYLAVHFQAALERQIARKRVLLVCSTGIGTSHLLKNRILRAFPDWIIAGVVSARNMEPFCRQEKIDLVISTIRLPVISPPVVYVSAFLNDEDIKRVTEKVISEKLHRAVAPFSSVEN